MRRTAHRNFLPESCKRTRRNPTSAPICEASEGLSRLLCTLWGRPTSESVPTCRDSTAGSVPSRASVRCAGCRRNRPRAGHSVQRCRQQKYLPPICRPNTRASWAWDFLEAAVRPNGAPDMMLLIENKNAAGNLNNFIWIWMNDDFGNALRLATKHGRIIFLPWDGPGPKLWIRCIESRLPSRSQWRARLFVDGA